MHALINRIVIGVFLALVLGVIGLQTVGKWNSKASVVVTDEPLASGTEAVAPIPEICGDRQCTGSENCSSCQADCGLCIQTYCCSTERRECDGPFGVAPSENPCEVAGYAKFLYAYENGNIEQRSKAYMTCNNSCASQE